jgi:hypothetical protein
MKALKLITIAALFFMAMVAKAQVNVSVNVGSPPMWGPVGYSEVRYYYLPGVESYYDVQSSMFIYYSGGVWVHRAYLPSQYRNYDLYNGYKVVMTDYRGDTPYMHFKEHKRQYSKNYSSHAQRTIGDRPGDGQGERNGNGNEGRKNHGGHGHKKGN